MNSRTSKKILICAISLAVLAGLFTTNPNEDQFASFKRTQLSDELSQRLGKPIDKDGFLYKITMGLLEGMLKANVVRANYGVFSIFKIDASAINTTEHPVADDKYLGIAGHFFHL